MALSRRLKYEPVRPAGDEAIGINGIPSGDEDVDFVGMSKERTHRLGIPCQIEKGLGLFSTNRETKKEDRDCEQESAFHRLEV